MLVAVVYSPSARRVIPYPPVSLAVLASALGEQGISARQIDLEMLVADAASRGEPLLVTEHGIEVSEVLSETLLPEVAAYADFLRGAVQLPQLDRLAISVMGQPQLASALLLARRALELGVPVILGGQFFTYHGAEEVLDALAPFGEATATVGDGWEAIVEFVRNPSALPTNSIGYRNDVIERGQRGGRSPAPAPKYDDVDWSGYERFGAAVYDDPVPTRRAHLYVWDKRCNFRCAFCRVASGSDSTLQPAQRAAAGFPELVDLGVTQFNFMTNELNPSLKYMRNFLRAMGSTPDGCAWFTYLRADAMDLGDLVRFRATGGRLARFGVESGSQRMLDRMIKDYDLPTIERTLAHAAAAGIWNHVNLLIGFPGETQSDVDQTCAFVERNAANIHSVRVNPFYLPPDTPIAREPERFGIRLENFESGWWNFSLIDGTRPDSDGVARQLDQVAATCSGAGISFAGTDPFFLLNLLARETDREMALARLRRDYEFFWTPAPTDFYKAKIGGYEASSEWSETVNQRGKNYSLSLCLD